MDLLAIDLASVASLTTAAGTLVLAVATFAAIRSSNRSARIAEAALQEQRRPLLAPSRLEDPMQKIMFMEGRWVRAGGQRGVAEHDDLAVFLAMSLRNIGSGIAVCQGWLARTGRSGPDQRFHAPLEDLRLQSRDLYIPAGDIGMWQGALRHPDDPVRAALVDAIDARQPITIELLYSDQIGRQRTISRFGLYPAGDTWLVGSGRHWYLDWDGPRSEEASLAAAEVITSERDLAEARRADLAHARDGVDALGLDDVDTSVGARIDPDPAG